MDKDQVCKVTERISAVQSHFPPDNTLPIPTLFAIYEHCGSDIPFTMETGTGLSTILFCHISKSHKAFSLNDQNMINVKKCEIFNSQNVEFIEGLTQKTLTFYDFKNKFNVVLLDGPHGYPFPELEYYYTYQHIENGGILIIDDIRIPTIYNLFCFLKEDDMFELLEVAESNTAFFKRTSVPLFNPYADGWWLQKYNKKYYPVYPVGELAGSLDHKDKKIQQLEEELNELRSSVTWRAVLKVHSIIDRLLPAGTRRHTFIKSAVKRIMRL